MNTTTMLTETKENKVKRNVSVAVVAASNRKRNSLRTLLRAISQLEIISLQDDVSSALELSVDQPPDLLVLDIGPDGDEAWKISGQVKTEWRRTRCLVLVNTIQQQQMAKRADADGILVNGFSIDEFFTLVDRLLSPRDSSQPQ